MLKRIITTTTSGLPSGLLRVSPPTHIINRLPSTLPSISKRASSTMSAAVDTMAAANGSAHTKAATAATCACNDAWLTNPQSQTPPPSSLTADQVAIIKATAPVLKEHGVTITTLFYKNMIGAHPELRNVFSSTSQATGAQPRALAASVLAYATYIDDLPKLHHAVERIAHKHVSLNIRPEQYGIVGHHLIGAIGAVLGDAATPAIVGAWTQAYAVLAGVFISREGQLFGDHADWIGFRPFKVVRKERETPAITSFYLAPSDGRPLPPYKPGQYLSLQLNVPEMGHLQSRQYSLNEAPPSAGAGGAYYRVSVKREVGSAESGSIAGIVSNMLHDDVAVGDEVEVSHPQGEFFVDVYDESKKGAPLVLLSAGVGATPLMSILDASTREGAVERPVCWVQGAHSAELRPFKGKVAEIRERSGADGRVVGTKVFLSTAAEGEECDFGGMRIDLDKLDREKDLYVGDQRAEYYVCGPEEWMLDVRRKLVEEMGVALERVNLELFRTGDV